MGQFHDLNTSDEAEISLEFSYIPGQRPTYGSWSDAGDPGYPAEVDVREFSIKFGSRKCSFVLHPADLTPDAQKRLTAYLTEAHYEDMCSEIEDLAEDRAPARRRA
jgi:hypothetical protein